MSNETEKLECGCESHVEYNRCGTVEYGDDGQFTTKIYIGNCAECGHIFDLDGQ